MRAPAYALIAAILGSAMGMIDGTAVNVALPILARDLHASATAVQWVIEGYALFSSALILIGGALGDRYGRRRIFVTGVWIFAIASVACGFAPNGVILILARCIQGAGAALLIPGSLALITAAYDEKIRGAAIGTWSATSAATMSVGPLLGGWFAQAVGWRLIFFINVPIAAAIVLLCAIGVSESRDEEETGRPDWLGATIVTLGLGLLVFGLIRLQAVHADILGSASAIAGAAFIALFVFVERRERDPMIPLNLFRSRTFSIANAYTLFLYGALGGSLFFVPFELINVRHYSPVAAGAALLPLIVCVSVFSRFTGALSDRIGPRIPLTAGAAFAALGFLLFGFAGQGSYWTTFFPAALVLGIGAALFAAPITTAVMNAVPATHAGAASGINNAVSRAAGLIAVAVMGIAVSIGAHGQVLSGAAYQAGFRDAMLLGAFLAAASSLLALLTIGKERKSRPSTSGSLLQEA